MAFFAIDRSKTLAVPDIRAIRVRGFPDRGKVLAVCALAFGTGIFWISSSRRQEMLTSTAEHDIESIPIWPFDHLPCNILASCGLCRIGHIGINLPIALGDMGIG